MFTGHLGILAAIGDMNGVRQMTPSHCNSGSRRRPPLEPRAVLAAIRGALPAAADAIAKPQAMKYLAARLSF
jgi:hypothetical protein